MSNNVFRLWNQYISKRLLLALLVSLLLHLYTLGGLDISLPDLDLSEDVVEVTLAPPVIKPAPPLPPQKAKPKAKTEKPAAKPKAEPLPAQPAEQPQLEPLVEPQPASAETASVAEEAAVEQESSQPQALQEEEAVASRFKPATYIETVFKASSGGVNGVSRINYKANPDGTYTLRSEAEVKGFAGLFFGKLLQTSEGTVGSRGLKPGKYFYQYGSNEDKIRRASFDWVSGKLTMEVGKKAATVALQEGTQDLLSFMYQFMFVPPLDDMHLLVTDGRKLRSYAYTFEGEEELATELGVIKALHIGKTSSEGEEKTEVWLGVDYNYLPVRIRKTDKEGRVIDQVVTSIRSDMFN